VVEDLRDHRGLLDHRDEPHPPAALEARHHVPAEPVAEALRSGVDEVHEAAEVQPGRRGRPKAAAVNVRRISSAQVRLRGRNGDEGDDCDGSDDCCELDASASAKALARSSTSEVESHAEAQREGGRP
jgi:hypothetical protein